MYQNGDYAVARLLAIGIVFLFSLSALVLAMHTPETRYAVDQTTIEQQQIYNSANRYGIDYVKPLGGFGLKGASSGTFGRRGVEGGSSILETNAFISRGRDPTRISNSYANARGYQIINAYVELEPVGTELVERPQITSRPRGVSRIISQRPKQLYLPQATVYLRTTDLVPSAGNAVFEAWLVDEDTNYAMSLGIFQPSEIGRIASLDYSSTTALDPFDTIMVTEEPFPDDDPQPGDIVLSGALPMTTGVYS